MIVCPICEHPQAQGPECDNCGKRLVQGPAANVLVAALPGLEATRHDEAPAPVASAPVVGLERTRMAPAPAPPPTRIPDLDRGRSEAVGAVAAQPLAELDTGRVAPEAKTPVPAGAAVCRYCRNVQPSGLLCDRCGMRLSRVPPAQPAAAGPARPEVRCGDCGTQGAAGSRCVGCGARISGGGG